MFKKGYKQTEEHKQKIREALKGKQSKLKGRHLTEETKEKIRNSITGKKRIDMIGENNISKRDEVRKKISKFMTGRHLTEETKEKLRLINIGNIITNETKEKISKSLKGKYVKEKSASWKGGDSIYWHRIAWDKFGKSKCERCGMTLEEHREKYDGYRLEMHNTLDPKDYKCMEARAWNTYCKVCHRYIENGG